MGEEEGKKCEDFAVARFESVEYSQPQLQLKSYNIVTKAALLV